MHNNQHKIKHIDGSAILYDDAFISKPNVALFDFTQHRQQTLMQGGVGRAQVAYFSIDDKSYVLKHYYRGGLVASLFKDKYLGFSIEASRAFKEWRLLKKMTELNLPVPNAVAARVEKKPFFYRADLITEEIKDIKTLSDCLTLSGLDAALWLKIGACIKEFHLHNVFHADLNARNILISNTGKVYLIDFDNSYMRKDSASWKNSNLARLKRSLLKFKNNTVHFNFDEVNWLSMMEGYNSD